MLASLELIDFLHLTQLSAIFERLFVPDALVVVVLVAAAAVGSTGDSTGGAIWASVEFSFFGDSTFKDFTTHKGVKPT